MNTNVDSIYKWKQTWCCHLNLEILSISWYGVNSWALSISILKNYFSCWSFYGFYCNRCITLPVQLYLNVTWIFCFNEGVEMNISYAWSKFESVVRSNLICNGTATTTTDNTNWQLSLDENQDYGQQNYMKFSVFSH